MFAGNAAGWQVGCVTAMHGGHVEITSNLNDARHPDSGIVGTETEDGSVTKGSYALYCKTRRDCLINEWDVYKETL